MGKIRLKPDEIKYITLFETLTGASIKDCVPQEGVMGFLVKKGDMGLKIRLKLADQGTWIFTNSETGTAERNRPLSSNVLVEMCARCHSRRTAITDEYVYGKHSGGGLCIRFVLAEQNVSERCNLYRLS